MVSYALKKLQNLGLVKAEKRGKEVFYSANEKGQEVCRHCSEVREQVLVSNLGGAIESFDLAELARFLRTLSGLYDQASRAAASL